MLKQQASSQNVYGELPSNMASVTMEKICMQINLYSAAYSHPHCAERSHDTDTNYLSLPPFLSHDMWYVPSSATEQLYGKAVASTANHSLWWGGCGL